MGVFAYLVYALTAFTAYMAYVLDFQMFKSVVLPWVAFMVVLFAPLVYSLIRTTKGDSK